MNTQRRAMYYICGFTCIIIFLLSMALFFHWYVFGGIDAAAKKINDNPPLTMDRWIYAGYVIRRYQRDDVYNYLSHINDPTIGEQVLAVQAFRLGDERYRAWVEDIAEGKTNLDKYPVLQDLANAVLDQPSDPDSWEAHDETLKQKSK